MEGTSQRLMEGTSQRLMEGTSQWGKGRVNDWWKGRVNDGRDEESTTFDCHWKSMESWVGLKNVVFVASTCSYSFFSKSTEEVFSVHECVALSKHVTHLWSTFRLYSTWETRTHHREGPQWNVARIMLQLKITLITSVLKVLTRAITSVTNISL